MAQQHRFGGLTTAAGQLLHRVAAGPGGVRPDGGESGLISQSRWVALWQALGRPAPALVFEALAERYAEAHRHYPTAQHIAECLAHFDGARALCEQVPEVEIALWFHDAVYDPRRNDNEDRSGDLAVAVLSAAMRSRLLIV